MEGLGKFVHFYGIVIGCIGGHQQFGRFARDILKLDQLAADLDILFRLVSGNHMVKEFAKLIHRHRISALGHAGVVEEEKHESLTFTLRAA